MVRHLGLLGAPPRPLPTSLFELKEARRSVSKLTYISIIDEDDPRKVMNRIIIKSIENKRNRNITTSRRVVFNGKLMPTILWIEKEIFEKSWLVSCFQGFGAGQI